MNDVILLLLYQRVNKYCQCDVLAPLPIAKDSPVVIQEGNGCTVGCGNDDPGPSEVIEDGITKCCGAPVV